MKKELADKNNEDGVKGANENPESKQDDVKAEGSVSQTGKGRRSKKKSSVASSTDSGTSVVIKAAAEHAALIAQAAALGRKGWS